MCTDRKIYSHVTTNFFRSKGYQIFYGIGLHSHVLDVQELDAMNGIEHAVPCLQGAVLFKLSIILLSLIEKWNQTTM